MRISNVGTLLFSPVNNNFRPDELCFCFDKRKDAKCQTEGSKFRAHTFLKLVAETYANMYASLYDYKQITKAW